MVVDHINHDTLNNTRKNLRVITKSENGKHKKNLKKYGGHHESTIKRNNEIITPTNKANR